MSQILVENLSKRFRISERSSGPWGSVRGLFSRKYKEIAAVDDLSFSIEPGELVGYIGPNGAGKSTTIKMLSGILTPSSGKCEILGLDPSRQRRQHVANIGAVFGQRTQLWWDLPVEESFQLLRDIYSIPHERYLSNRSSLVEILQLTNYLSTPVRQLSLGWRMRCELAAALLHEPPILFLDEPTIGLDAVSKLALRDHVKQLNRERGVTVLLTTHDMDDIASLCSRIMVIAEGKSIFDGTIEQLRRSVSNNRRLTVDLKKTIDPVEVEGAKIIEWLPHQAVFEYNPDKTSTPELIQKIATVLPILDLKVENPEIEKIIARIYREQTSLSL